jgi:hypothetical protein
MFRVLSSGHVFSHHEIHQNLSHFRYLFPPRFPKLSTRRKQSYILYLMSDWWVFVQSGKLSSCSFQQIWPWSKIPSENSAIALEIRDLLSESRNINMSLKWLCAAILLFWLLQDWADKFILLKKKQKKKKKKKRKIEGKKERKGSEVLFPLDSFTALVCDNACVQAHVSNLFVP